VALIFYRAWIYRRLKPAGVARSKGPPQKHFAFQYFPRYFRTFIPPVIPRCHLRYVLLANRFRRRCCSDMLRTRSVFSCFLVDIGQIFGTDIRNSLYIDFRICVVRDWFKRIRKSFKVSSRNLESFLSNSRYSYQGKHNSAWNANIWYCSHL
jgi:hypothetical protein